MFSQGVIHAYVCCHSDESLKSGVYIVQLRINTEHDKSYFINFKLIYGLK